MAKIEPIEPKRISERGKEVIDKIFRLMFTFIAAVSFGAHFNSLAIAVGVFASLMAIVKEE
jgi:hypothetical protein